MGYIPNHPQTNLSIGEFYQKLGYKYKDWISEFNKYEDIMPVEQNQKGEEIPKDLQSNNNIQFITKTPTYPRYRGHTSLEYAEGLLAREVLETTRVQYAYSEYSHEYNTTIYILKPLVDHTASEMTHLIDGLWWHFYTQFEDDYKWHYYKYQILYEDNTPYETPHIEITSEEVLSYTIEKRSWDAGWDNNPYLDFSQQYSQFQYGQGTEEEKFKYPRLLKLSHIYKSKSDGSFEYLDKLVRKYPHQAIRYLGWFYTGHFASGNYLDGERVETSSYDKKYYIWASLEFSNSIDPYKINESIVDRRINVLTDIDAIASS